MKKLKDIIYDYNDIFIAILILAVAALVIMWRVTDIMAYSSYLDAKQQVASSDVDFSDVDLTQTEIEDFNENPEDFNSDSSGSDAQNQGSSDAAQGDAQQGQSGNEGSQEQTGGQQTGGQSSQQPSSGGQTGQVTAATKTIVIPQGSFGSTIGDILVKEGLVSSRQQFLDAVTAKNAEKKLKAGTFTIPAGSTVEQIVDIIAK